MRFCSPPTKTGLCWLHFDSNFRKLTTRAECIRAIVDQFPVAVAAEVPLLSRIFQNFQICAETERPKASREGDPPPPQMPRGP